MKSEQKAKRLRGGPRLAALSVLLLAAVLSGGTALWAQSKSLTVDGKAVAGGERRVALVIGNAAYDTAPLRNPVNDARAMATTLRTLGFEVTALENATLTDMKRAIDDFGDRLRSGGVGLFYFSGHGVQIQGRNFLVPIGVRVKGERDVEYEAVDAGRVLGKMEDAGNRMNLVILDACRDNPFARSFRSAAAGLASMDAASGTFVAYATAPGRTADDGSGGNGLYTEQLMRYMRTPGLKVEDVFKRVRIDVERVSGGKQVPWESSSLKGDFYFAGAPVEAALASPPPPASPGKPAGPARTIDEEEALWKVIEASTNPVDFEEYLAAFPQGRFVGAARARLRQLRRQESPQPGEQSPQRLPSATTTTGSPSFDCTKASLPTERLICAHDALSTLDVQMARLYSAALARTADREALRKAQRTWLKTRRDACPDVVCLRRAYHERIAELSR
jgi:Caspase domain/Lysozyme inhibitor LprI